MDKKIISFLPEIYKISIDPAAKRGSLLITGRRGGPPNRRLSLNQKGLKVISAEIIYHQKGKEIRPEIIRINHLPTIEEVRLHTASPLFPGQYEIKLTFAPADITSIRTLADKDIQEISLRQLFPSIDNKKSRALVKVEVIEA